MGNTSQNTQLGESIEVNISHPKFTNTKLIKSPNEVFIQSIIMCEQKQFLKLQKQLQPLQKQKNDHLLLPKSIKFETTRLCGSNGHMQLLYPYYPYLLSEQVYNRNGKHVKFDETDLWYLLYCISAGKEELIQAGCNNASQQNVDMGNIFLNDEGRVKIACRQSWPGSISLWQRALQKQPVYLSSQCFSRIAKGEMQPQGEQQKKLMQSQSQFSIGLTLLNSALLIDESTSQQLIDYKQMTYNSAELMRRINDFILTRGYSDILKSIILSLLSQLSQERLTHQQLWLLVKDHAEEIENRKNFVINNATVKVHKAVEKYRIIKAKLQMETQNTMVPEKIIVQQKMPNLFGNLQTSTVIKHQIVSTGLKSTDKVTQQLLPQIKGQIQPMIKAQESQKQIKKEESKNTQISKQQM